MNTSTLLAEVFNDGIILSASHGSLKFKGESSLIEKWKPRLVENKAAILSVISKSERASRWQVVFEDGSVGRAWACPPVTALDLMMAHPEIKTASVAPPEPKEKPSCRNCKNSAANANCLVPVEAGLSKVDGVIYYHPENGKGCNFYV
jgi:hypothetical protein